jgi:hypothetical protein
MTDKLEVLGFSINYEKSVLQPSQRIIFVGVIIDTVQFKVFLTQENNDKIKTSCKTVIENHCINIRTLASLIGLIIHAFNAVTYGQLHYRNLERDQIKHLRINYDDLNAFMTVSEASKSDIKWLLENVKIENGKLIRQSSVNEWLQTDASLKGWGASVSTIILREDGLLKNPVIISII